MAFLESEHLLFYTDERNKAADLYPSEEEIYSKLDWKDKKVLDVGCAAGGFCNILKHFSEDIDYYGIDISERLIDLAQISNPTIKDNFFIGSATSMQFDDSQFDVVICNSVQAHCKDYKELFFECWRVCAVHLIFDFRFFLKSERVNISENSSELNYFVLNPQDIFQLLSELNDLGQITFSSYPIAPNNFLAFSALLNFEEPVRCGLFLLEKRPSNSH